MSRGHIETFMSVIRPAVEITQHGDVVQNLNQQVLIFNLFPQNPFVQAFVEIGLGSGQKTSQQNPDRGFMENSVAS